MAAGVVAVIRIDTLWLCTQPQDMRAGADRLLNIVVNTVGAAQAHHGYLFANPRATRVKLLVHDGFGVWCATRRLHAGRFVWHRPRRDRRRLRCSSAPSSSRHWCWACPGSAWANWPPSAAAERQPGR
jgi:transposase